MGTVPLDPGWRYWMALGLALSCAAVASRAIASWFSNSSSPFRLAVDGASDWSARTCCWSCQQHAWLGNHRCCKVRNQLDHCCRRISWPFTTCHLNSRRVSEGQFEEKMTKSWQAELPSLTVAGAVDKAESFVWAAFTAPFQQAWLHSRTTVLGHASVPFWITSH